MTNKQALSDTFISEVLSRLQGNKRIRRSLPEWGRLHIDRQLPFLSVYRQPTRRQDAGTDRLILGQPSYLLAKSHKSHGAGVAKLVSSIAAEMSAAFGGFLVLEIWSQDTQVETDLEPNVTQPAFKLFASNYEDLAPTIATLETELTRIAIDGQPALVSVVARGKPHPPRYPNLFNPSILAGIPYDVIGIAVKPNYQHPVSGDVLPLIQQSLTAQFNKALQRTAFTFVRTQTSFRPPHYQALGRRATVKAVWEIDKQLAHISNSFDFLLQVTPVNPTEAWKRFKHHHFERFPTFRYRPPIIDPALLKRQLWNIRLERVEDPVLQHLFREKRHELDIQISMLANMNTPNFLLGSWQLYGQLDDSLIDVATTLLHRISPQDRTDEIGNVIGAQEFANRARAYIANYRKDFEGVAAKVHIRSGLSGLMVSQGDLLVADDLKISESRLDALLAHEVGVHTLTYYNGKAQPFQLLQSGLAGYEELQEGLAVLAEYLVGGLSKPRLRLLAGRVLAADSLVKGATFIDTYRLLRNDFGFRQQLAFTIAMRIYRGGGLTKDAVYLRGLAQLIGYLRKKPLQDLFFIGKIAIEHVPIVQELQRRKVLLPQRLRPHFLDHESAEARLQQLQQEVTILDLI